MKNIVVAIIKSIYLNYTNKKNASRNLISHRMMSEQLLIEIQEAHKEWRGAMNRLNYACDADQIDYAVYSLEAAQKRYEMLIRTAKKHRVSRT